MREHSDYSGWRFYVKCSPLQHSSKVLVVPFRMDGYAQVEHSGQLLVELADLAAAAAAVPLLAHLRSVDSDWSILRD